MTRARELYDRWRRVEPDAKSWVYLSYDEKLFWERLAKVVG